MRRDGCGGRVGWEGELLTGIETVSRRPIRKIVLQEGWLTGSAVSGKSGAAAEGSTRRPELNWVMDAP
jgi:hypothetical protein